MLFGDMYHYISYFLVILPLVIVLIGCFFTTSAVDWKFIETAHVLELLETVHLNGRQLGLYIVIITIQYYYY